MADQLAKARVSGHTTDGIRIKPQIAIIISPEDRDLLVEALRRMGEVVDAS